MPAGFGAALEGAGNPAERVVQVLADGTDANSSGVALSYVARVVSEFNADLAVRAGDTAGIDGRVRVWFNPDLESRDFMVPGVIALLLLVITANLSSMAIVRERELGTLEQLNVTPLGRWELMLGKLLPYGVVGLIDVILVVIVAVFWFEVPLRGSVPLLLGASLIYLLCTLGLGLFVSTISSTQQQAMMTSTFFFLMPMIYLSGLHLPDREHAAADPVGDVRHSAALLPRHCPRHLPEGRRPGRAVAAGRRPRAWGVTVLVLAALRSNKRA